ncbi:MAG: folate family ECF transporter S component [Clostridia bacterium]|nr:folate family ECF transporter S component [Clostridia bacterium]
MQNFLLSPSFTNSFDFSYVFKTFITKWYYYLALAVILVLVVCFLFIKKQPERNRLSKTQKIVYTGILSSFCAVANIFDIPINSSLQLSLVATVGFVSGYLLGGGLSFAVCFIGDLVGGIIAPKGPYNPIIAIGTGLWGLIPGIAFSYFRGNEVLKLVISFVLGFAIISLTINTVGYALMYPKYTTFALSFAMLPFKLIVAVVNAVVSAGLMVAMRKVLPKDKFLINK